MKNQPYRSIPVALVIAVILASALVSGQVQMCIGSTAPACQAVRGDRSEGWLPQTRSEVMARNGMVTTVQPLASQAGLRILQQGGNAIDAAVAAAAALNVTYPANTGIGGDLFALIYIAKEKKVYQLNASGIAPSGLTLATMSSLGYKADAAKFGPGSGMPGGGILTVTVPGSLWGWQEVLTRFGTRTFKDVLQPAIDYADQGFPITEEIAAGWRMKNALPLQGCCTQIDPDSAKTFYIDGNRPTTGTIFRNPDLAKTFRLVQEQGRDVFYKGEVARAIIAKSKALGGPMTLDDLASYKGEWVTPASTTYHDQYTVYGTRAPSQAWGIVEAMNVLDACVPAWYPGQTLATLGPANPLYWHALIEAKKVVYADVYGQQRRPECRDRAAREADVESLRGDALRQSGSQARIPRPVRRPPTPATSATRSTSPPPIGGATWCRGSTATLPGGAPASPYRDTDSSCTTAAGCSRSIPTART